MPQSMPLKPTTVRFAEDGMLFVQRAADEVGSSVSQFIREAALIRAAWVMKESTSMSISDLAEEVRRMSRDED